MTFKAISDLIALRTNSSGVASSGQANIRWNGTSLQTSVDGGIYRSVMHPEINVLDFGADPTGVADSSQAFRDAIAYFPFVPVFGQLGDAGTVVIPPGIYRISSSIHIKRSVWLRGSSGSNSNTGCSIRPDPGITPFIFDRYNTPIADNSGFADNAVISNLFIYNPNHKCSTWTINTHYSIGNRVKTGPAPGQGAITIGEHQYSHYECTTAGTSMASGVGPQSYGDDKILNYKLQTVNFTIGDYVIGATSGAEGIICTDTDNGATGTLRLTSVYGTFIDNEIISNYLHPGSATVNGTISNAVDDELDGTVRWKYIGPGAGIKIRANGVVVRDVAIAQMSGNGILIWAGDPEVPWAFANANGWQCTNVGITSCDGHGLFVNGGDSNGGTWTGGAMASNGGPASDESFTGPGFNLYDSSFLGNTYTGCEFFSVGGQGGVFCDSIGGGSTFLGCYQEGTGGGHNIITNSSVVVGGGLSVSDFRSIGAPNWYASSATVIGPIATSTGLGASVRGYSAESWRHNAYIPIGIQRANGNNVYACITAGFTASAGGGPTGTGSDIVDNTVHWAFVHTFQNNGLISFGSANPSINAFFTMAPPDDIGADYLYFRHDTFPASGVSKTYGFHYGISGSNPGEGDWGNGLMHASNETVLTEWPTKVAAGTPIVEHMYLGGCKVTYGTGIPVDHTWNPGDRIYYKGSAVVPGGAEGLICTTEGTAGTYTGGRTITANGTTTVTVSGAPMISLFDQHDFRVGMILTINGITSRVQSISRDDITLVMGSPITTGSGLIPTFSHPVFKEFGLISL